MITVRALTGGSAVSALQCLKEEPPLTRLRQTRPSRRSKRGRLRLSPAQIIVHYHAMPGQSREATTIAIDRNICELCDTDRYGRSSRGWLLASDSLPCWRKARCKAMVRHRFRGLLPFCLCPGASRQKGRRDEIESPSWFCTVAHHATQPPRASHPPLNSRLRSRENRPGTAALRWWCDL